MRTLSTWFLVTTAIVVALVLTISPAERRGETAEGFDQPGAAAWHELHDVAVDREDAGRPEAVVRIHARPRRLARPNPV